MPVHCAVNNSINDIDTSAVEVSGWDTEGQFFIEVADLELNDSGGTAVSLCHRVHSGSLVFVRLFHGEGQDTYEKGYPTANEALAAEPPDFTGRSRIRLVPCHPRATRRRGDRKGATCI